MLYFCTSIIAIMSTKGNDLKPHIGIFGRRNNGKSSLVNYLTGQNVAIVSPTPGATTDPVRKTMELGGVGPVIWIDTAGIDDVGDLGRLRSSKSLDELRQCDMALILVSDNLFADEESNLVELCRRSQVPYLLLYSRSDVSSPVPEFLARVERIAGMKPFVFNINNDSFREPLLALIRQSLPQSALHRPTLLGDVVNDGDCVVMVTPIDSSAPEGRMILPQVQVLRDLLDNNACVVVCKETGLRRSLSSLSVKPRLVVTDSQVYKMVAEIVPDDIFLTSFSVVLARAKGLFDMYVKGTPVLARLSDGDRVLLLESCTHNVTCEDIGRVKIPKMIRSFTGRQIEFDIVGGMSAVERDIHEYSLVIQCGGCVVSQKQLFSRLMPFVEAGIPVSNYGLSIAFMNGIFERSMRIFNKM